MKKEKDYSIVFLRAIAILIVMIGHSIIIYDSAWGLYTSSIQSPFLATIKHIINIIQMPIWFFIAGYLYKKKAFKTTFMDKFCKLMIPFLMVGLFYLIPIRYLVHYQNYVTHSILYNILYYLILGFDNGHLWYLPTLFIMFLFFYKKEYSKFFKIILFVVLAILSIYSFYFSSYIISLFQFAIFFYLGILAQNVSLKKDWSPYLLILYFTFLLLFQFASLPFLVSRVITLFLQILEIVLLVKIDYSRWGKNSIIQKIADASYGIYLFHSPLIYITFSKIPNAHPIIIILINFCLFGSLSYLLFFIIRRTKFKFIIGEK